MNVRCGIHKAVRENQAQPVVVWSKEASSSRYVAEVLRYCFSQRFLEANAIIIQTFFRLRRMRVSLQHRRQCNRLLFYIGQAVS